MRCVRHIKRPRVCGLKYFLHHSYYITQKYIIQLEKKNLSLIKKYFNFAEKSDFPNLKNIEKINYNLKENRIQKKIKKIKNFKISYKEKLKQVKGY